MREEYAGRAFDRAFWFHEQRTHGLAAKRKRHARHAHAFDDTAREQRGGRRCGIDLAKIRGGVHARNKREQGCKHQH